MPNLIQNRKAHFDYEFLEKIESGIELHGFEVKALRESKGRLDGSYVVTRGGEAYIVNFHISPYQPGNTPKGYDPDRIKKLLLTKKEIAHIAGFEKRKGLTIVPISVYTKKSKIKIELAVAKGKKKFDKRETLKKRDTEREMRRDIKDL